MAACSPAGGGRLAPVARDHHAARLPGRSRSPTRSAGREASTPEPACCNTTIHPNTPAALFTSGAATVDASRASETDALSIVDERGRSACR